MEVVSIVAEECLRDLDAPLTRITTAHVPLPSADAIEDATLPSTGRIIETVAKVVG